LTQGVGARLVGPGVTTEPEGHPPVISFHVQTGLDRETSMVSGRPPATRADTGVVEVMVAADVADVLRVRTGGEYVAVTAGLSGHEVPIRVSGVFAARDAAAPVWQSELLLLETTLTALGDVPDAPMAVRAALVTDEVGMAVLTRPDLIREVDPLTGARIRLDAARLDHRWAAAAPAAVASAETDPRLRSWELRTRLPDLLETYAGRQRSSHALTAVVVGGYGRCPARTARPRRLAAGRRATPGARPPAGPWRLRRPGGRLARGRGRAPHRPRDGAAALATWR